MSAIPKHSGAVLTGRMAAVLAASGLMAGHQLVVRLGTLEDEGLVTVMVVRRIVTSEASRAGRQETNTRIELVEVL